jgi:hypothetical protein
MQTRVLKPYLLGAMHVGDEHLAAILKRAQERRLLAIAGVKARPVEALAGSARRAHDVEGMLALRGQLPCRHRNASLIAAPRILDPHLGKIKPHIDRHVVAAVRHHPKHRDLAVVDLAKPARPLPRHPDRALALLGEARLVDDQAAVVLPAEERVGIRSDLRHHRLVAPRRVADEMLKLLGAPLFHHLSHPGKGAPRRLGQALQIALRHRRIIASTRRKQPAVAVNHATKILGNRLDQRSSRRPPTNTVT